MSARLPTSPHSPSEDCEEWDPGPTPDQHSTSPSDVSSIWNAALDEYARSVGVNLRDHTVPFVGELEQCSSTDDVLDVLQNIAEYLRDWRRGGNVTRVLKEWLKPVIHGLSVILDASGETGSSLGLPGGKGIFSAVAMLLRAADRVSATFEDLRQLFERLAAYVERLQVRIQVPMTFGAKTVVVRALVEMLKAIGLATKMLQKGRMGLFLGALFTKSDEVQSAIRCLEDIMVDEERMAVTDVIVGMHGISSEIRNIRTSMSTPLNNFDEFRSVFQHSSHVALSEVRENERQRRADNDSLRSLLQSLFDRLNHLDTLRLVAPTQSQVLLAIGGAGMMTLPMPLTCSEPSHGSHLDERLHDGPSVYSSCKDQVTNLLSSVTAVASLSLRKPDSEPSHSLDGLNSSISLQLETTNVCEDIAETSEELYRPPLRWPTPEEQLRETEPSDWDEDITRRMSFSPISFAALPPRAPSPERFNALSPPPHTRQRSRSPTPPIPSLQIDRELLPNVHSSTRAMDVTANMPIKGDACTQRQRACSLRSTRLHNSIAYTRARMRSPPPTPRRPSIIPPVPPLPEFARAKLQPVVLRPQVITDDIVPVMTISQPLLCHPRFRPSSVDIMCTTFTCISFLTLHNSRGSGSLSKSAQ